MLARLTFVLLVVATHARADVAIVREGACSLDELPPRATALVGTPDVAGTILVRTTSTRAEIEILGSGAAPRVVEAPDCDALLEPAAIIVAILIRSLPPPRMPISPPPVVPDAPTPDVPRPPAVTHHRVASVELGGGSTLAGIPMLLGGARLSKRGIALAAELALAPPTDHVIAMGNIEVSSGRFTLAPCIEHRGLAACALVSGGWVRGSRGGMGARTSTLPVAGVGARLEWRRQLTARIGLRGFVEGRYFTNQVEFLIDDAPIWRSPTSETVIGLGGFVQIP